MSIDRVNILQGWMSDENGEFNAESLTELEKRLLRAMRTLR